MSNDNGGNYLHPRCPRCGGRLFQESEFRGKRLLYFWECSLGCSRQWDGSDGKPLSYLVAERSFRGTRRLVPVG